MGKMGPGFESYQNLNSIRVVFSLFPPLRRDTSLVFFHMIKTCLHLSFKLKPYNFSHLQGTNLVPCSQFPKSPGERPLAQLRLGICPWSSQLQSGDRVLLYSIAACMLTLWERGI